MNRPDRSPASPAGYTLVEILVATSLALLLLGAVITMFGRVGESITDSRAMLETADRLRLAETRLQQDLAGITVTMLPPRKPESNEGYFEYIEGPITQATASTVAVNTELSSSPGDTTVGDFDDILMFTTRSSGRPFVGKCGAGNTIQSDVAEVAWFLRGRTLHRRVLLVAPSATMPGSTAGYYADYDVSARVQGGIPVANTLGDLTRRECRFAHIGSFPYDVRDWYWTVPSDPSRRFPTLPTLVECADWLPGTRTYALSQNLDFWTTNSANRMPDAAFASGGRVADDIILTNVIGFDVKAWDPTANGGRGDYVNLGNGGAGQFSGTGARVGVNSGGNAYLSRTYDTWSTHYETVGAADLVGTPGQATNGLDDGGTTDIVDDDGEKLTSPPYPYPLRGIQVKIRVFEPDSRQIREVTVVQEFLPQ